MVPNLIIMLTKNDVTVDNALETFNSCRDLPIQYWGFKNVGLSKSEMSKLISSMKASGKKIFLEVVTYNKESCMEAARFACDSGIDYLIGTLYFPDVWKYLKSMQIQYFPFIGNVHSNPSILTGTSKDMISQANNLYKKNIPGVDILAYRYDGKEPEQLAKEIVTHIKSKAIIAGSIDSIERLKEVMNIHPWGFTIGSALFNGNFAYKENFRTNLEKVLKIIDMNSNSSIHTVA